MKNVKDFLKEINEFEKLVVERAKMKLVNKRKMYVDHVNYFEDYVQVQFLEDSNYDCAEQEMVTLTLEELE